MTMGLSYSTEKELVTVVSDGSFGLGEIRATFSRIRSECEPASRVRILIVDQASDFDPTHEEVQEFVDLWGALFGDVSARIALVVKRELHYGLGRMAAVYAERHELPFRVFRRRAEAVEWLFEKETIDPYTA
jgi:hypothetical protein